MIEINSENCPFVGTILLAPPEVSARVLALFNASAGENRIKSLPGFIGAALLVTKTGNRVFEFVIWESAEAVKAARDDHRFADHSTVVKQYAEVTYVAFSPHLVTETGLILDRGAKLHLSCARLNGVTSASVVETIRRSAAERPNLAYQIADGPEGCVIVCISQTAHEPIATLVVGAVEIWRDEAEIIETITAGPDVTGRAVTYRLYADGGQP